MAIERNKLEAHLNALLRPQLYKDYGPNGLQIEGRAELARVAFAVSATRESVNLACSKKADTLIVHHGLFWDFHGVRTLTGAFAKRVKPLVQNEINLFGYHLPLDGQQEMGNAASIASLLALTNIKPFGDHKGMPTGVSGSFSKPTTGTALQETLRALLHHQVMASCDDLQRPIVTLGIVTGGANGGWREAAVNKLDAFLTGEMSEHDWNEAKEAGVTMFAGGHHATEVFGIQSLMHNVQQTFAGLECFFIGSDNPA